MRGKHDSKKIKKAEPDGTALLYRIAKAMASVKDGRELLKIIVEETQPVFGFYDIGLSVLDKSGEFYTDWAVYYAEINPSEANLAQRELNLYQYPVDEPLMKHAVARAEKEKKPFVENMTAEFIEEFKDFPHLPLEIAHGYRQFLVTTLKFGGKTLGVLNFNSLCANHFDDCDLELFQAIADLVAVAVSNILANDEILEREREKSQLLAISEQLATIRDKHSLFDVIFNKLQPVFHFDDTAVALYDENLEYTQHLHSSTDENLRDNANYRSIMSEKVPTAGNPHGEFTNYKTAQIVTLEYFLEHYSHHVGVQVMKDFGLQECVIMPLRYGGRLLGTLEFHSRVRGKFNDSQMPLFRNLADQVAVAVSNILANKEIFDREREKSVLLAITEQIAVIRDKNDLFRVIAEKLKPIFDFDEASTVLFDQNFQYTQNIKGINSIIRADDELHNQMLAEKTNLENSPYQDIIHTQKPRIIKIESVAKHYPDFIGVKIVQSYGFREFVAMPLRYAGKLLGVFEIYSLTEGKFQQSQIPVYTHLADQIAVAVSNIFANEEILEREREKSVLLSISEAIATVRDKDELFGIFNQKLRPILGYDYASVLEVNNTRKHYRYYLTISDQSLEANELYNEAARFRPFNPYIESVLDSAAPVTYITDELLEQYPNGAGLKLQQSLGVEQSVVFVLKNAGQTVGLFILHYKALQAIKEERLPLFRNIANQVAVALGNILANDEILEREREKSRLLEITEVIAQVKATDDLLKLIVGKIKPLFDFHDCGIFIITADGKTHSDLAGPEVSPSDWNRMISEASQLLPHKGSPVEWMMSEIDKRKSPINFDFVDLVKNFPDYPQIKDADLLKMGYRDCLAANLVVRGKSIGMFCINALAKDFFPKDVTPLFQAVTNNISIAVANILANEEIQNQLAEITDLKKRLEAENKYLTEEVGKNYNFEEIVGTSPRLRQVFEIIETVAPTDATVLIQGETGTGKELAARAVHNRSTRSARPLIKINCAALPRELVESELFGHERGSFTGARERRIGKFELADQGTIFLDEIGELPLDAQVKLLRVLQEKEIERLGGKGTIKLDLRVVAATNRNLAAEVQAGRFRADLYYRLSTVELFIPALRERREDIEPLTLYFACKYAAKFSRRIERVSTEMLRELNRYGFPGNIRELEHIVEHAVIFSKNEKLILPRPLAGTVEKNQVSDGNESAQFESSDDAPQTLSSIEREHIIEVLRQTSGRIKGKGGAAEILGLNPATVYFRMKKLGINTGRR